jgi:hypothetical protein
MILSHLPIYNLVAAILLYIQACALYYCLLGKSANAIWMGVPRREPQDLLGPNRDVRFLHRLFRYWCDLGQLFQISVLNGPETGNPLLC